MFPESSSIHHNTVHDKKGNGQRRGSSSSASTGSSRIRQAPTMQSLVSSSGASVRQPQSQSGARPRKDQSKRPHHRPSQPKNVGETTDLVPYIESIQMSPSPSQTQNKKGNVSLNHLLNFTFPPRQQVPAPARRRQDKNFEPYNKEKYINANFRFVLYPDRDYRGAMVDPDMNVAWEDIAQVLAITEKEPSCPICLSTPVAPRMTHCGHIYCWPCLEHYVALGERAWRKCPICYDSVYLRDVKPVRFFYAKALMRPSPTHPQTLSFTLMKRRTGSSIALPATADALDGVVSEIFPPILKEDAALFSRYCMGSINYMKNHVWGLDLAKLEEQHADILSEREVYGSSSGVDANLPFVDACISKSKELMQMETLPAPPSIRKLLRSTSSNESALKPSKDDIGAYYFYQASDGRPFFLHPLDIKILKREFQDYSSFPETIQCRVISVQESTVDQVLRKKCKYLAHLPLSCDMTICNVDLTGIVSEDILKLFQGELKTRLERLENAVHKESLKTGNSQTSPFFYSDFNDSFAPQDIPSISSYVDEFPVPDPSMSSPTGRCGPSASSFQVSFARMASSSKTLGTTEKLPPPPGAEDWPSLGSPSSKVIAKNGGQSTQHQIHNHRRHQSEASDGVFEEDYYYTEDSFHAWTLDFEEAVLTGDSSSNGNNSFLASRKHHKATSLGAPSNGSASGNSSKEVKMTQELKPIRFSVHNSECSEAQASQAVVDSITPSPNTTPMTSRNDAVSEAMEPIAGKKKGRKQKKQLLVSNSGHRFR